MNRPPIFIELALWYYTTPLEHPMVGSHGAPAYNETVAELVKLGLLICQQSTEGCYKATSGLTVYVEALGNVPIPELRWVMPKENT